MFERKHHSEDDEFYADLLAHLLKGKMELGDKLVLNIAERGKTTRNQVLESARKHAEHAFGEDYSGRQISTQVVFNVQNHHTEPLLNIADYFCKISPPLH